MVGFVGLSAAAGGVELALDLGTLLETESLFTAGTVATSRPHVQLTSWLSERL